MAAEGPELPRCPLTSKCPRKFQTSPGKQASWRDTAVASAQWMKAWGWKSWYPQNEESEVGGDNWARCAYESVYKARV